MAIEGLAGDPQFPAQGPDPGLWLAYRRHRQPQFRRRHLIASSAQRPRARAAASPALVRSMISSRSNSARAAKIPKTSFPLAEEVSIVAPCPVSTLNPIPRA